MFQRLRLTFQPMLLILGVPSIFLRNHYQISYGDSLGLNVDGHMTKMAAMPIEGKSL